MTPERRAEIRRQGDGLKDDAFIDWQEWMAPSSPVTWGDLRELLTLAERQAWQPISSVPKDGTWVQTISRTTKKQWTVPITMRWHDERWDMGTKTLIVYQRPLFWRPLPDPPKGVSR